MNQDLPKKGEPLVFFDVETLPAEENDPIWALLTVEEGFDREELRKRTALNAPLGRAWMIGMAIGADEPTIFEGDGSVEAEKPVLEAFWEAIKDLDDPWWIGHNIEGYDIPFLQVRSLHHEMPHLARKLGRQSTKPWERRTLDTMKLWPRTGGDRSSWREGLRGIGKLGTICAVLGIDRQDGVLGAQVYEAWLAGDREGVRKHLDLDIRQVRSVFKRLFPIL